MNDNGLNNRKPELTQGAGAFQQVRDAAAITAADGGRVIPDQFGAKLLSDHTAQLWNLMNQGLDELVQKYGRPPDGPPPIQLVHSDSPDGPWTAVPPSDLRCTVLDIPPGPDLVRFNAIVRLSNSTAFSFETFNALQAQSPGATHPRYRQGDTIPQPQVATQDSAVNLLALADGGTKPSGTRPQTGFVPDGRDLEILRELDLCGRRIGQDMLRSRLKQRGVRISLRVLGTLLKALRAAELVSCPAGSRSGNTITEAGREILQRSCK